jgi:hypothetical protein
MKFTSIKTEESIDCGEETCGTMSGNACKFLIVRRNGEMSACLCEHTQRGSPMLETRNGWITRSKECMKTFKR